MLIVDSQVHLQSAGKPSPYHIQRDFLADEILKAMDVAGVDRAVIVPPSWDSNINGPALEAAGRYPSRFAVMGRIDFSQPDSRLRVQNWKSQPGMLGIRIVPPSFPPDVWQKGGRGEWLWSVCEQAGVPIMINIGYHASEVELFRELVAAYPNLKLIIDHLGAALSRGKNDAAFEHLPAILRFAKSPNVAVKASGVPSYSNEPYPFPRLHGYLRQVYDAFGPDRIFWGTDLSRKTYWDTPDGSSKCSYREAVTLFTEELSWLSERDRELIMGRALCQWIGWNWSHNQSTGDRLSKSR